MPRTRRRTRPLVDAVRTRQPRLLEAVAADVALARAQRAEPIPRSTLGTLAAAIALAWRTDAFEALLCYRIQAACERRGTWVVPTLAHRRAIARAGVAIGTPVHVAPGVLLPHGQVVIDGLTEIGAGTRIRPFVTIGLRERDITGPRIGRDVKIGTGASVIGPISVGDGATIGAGAIVVHDVPPGAVVVGNPARAASGVPSHETIDLSTDVPVDISDAAPVDLA